MRTFILQWRPSISSYRMEDFEEEMPYLEDGMFNWRVWENEKARSGDNFYMVKCSEGRTGIVMKGFFTSDPYEGDDWSGKGRRTFYMDMRPEYMIHPDRAPLLSTEDLEKAMPGFQWNGGHSGRELPEEYATKLGSMWEDYLKEAGDIFDGVKADRNLRPEADIDDAVEVASSAHYDRKDPDGRPVILHPLAVGMAGKTGEEMICGFLHDVLEDSEWTAGELRERGFSEKVVDTLLLLTHEEGTPYMDHVRRICESGNATAVAVKLSDLRHDLERERTTGRDRLARKHSEALEYMTDWMKNRQ